MKPQINADCLKSSNVCSGPHTEYMLHCISVRQPWYKKSLGIT